MTTVRPPNVGAGLEHRRVQLERTQDLTGRTRTYAARAHCYGIGEFAVEVGFPIQFTEEPIFTHGWVLGENELAPQGSYPTHSATVQLWFTRDIGGGLGKLYTGARVQMVLSGHPQLHYTTAHLRFEGMSLRNPIGGTTSQPTTETPVY